METIQVRFLGSGDAFGSGGRLQTCICIKAIFFEKQVKYHLDFQTLMAHLDELQPKRLIVTHMSEDMLARREKISCECAEDGKLIEV